MFRMSYNFCNQMTFENGLTISIAIGEENYCSNKNNEINPYETYIEERTSDNCEILVFNNSEDLDIQQFLPKGVRSDGNKVAGYVTPDSLAKVINNVANWRA